MLFHFCAFRKFNSRSVPPASFPLEPRKGHPKFFRKLAFVFSLLWYSFHGHLRKDPATHLRRCGFGNGLLLGGQVFVSSLLCIMHCYGSGASP